MGHINKKQYLWLGLVSALAGCTSVADMVGYDTETLNQNAAKSYAQVLNQAKSKHALDVSSPTAQRVYRVFNRLRPYADRANQTGVRFNWQMNVIRSNEMNAWAMPGGKMAVYTGMVERLKLTDDEIAAVIGHEMTHALQEHSKQAIGGQFLTGLGSSLLVGATGVDGDLVGLGSDLIATKPFSRHQESEADAGGVRLMAQAGYNPQAALTVWEKMNRAGNGTSIAILSTHPANETRMNAIRRILPEVMPIYERNKR
ncbi:M48 family metallopeptidase [Neisseria chenwenguii]|uniref:Deoxyribonuclease HsdR n=1 Tax=Neisseria chenwenguii TaxID=1853278 RepID=A0A220S3E3_9NEIS|nr:M48 family metallopeptidase [Neisseria chenwenguii]ASK27994.1 deoxyribonuclease HsdR [Neisseria chenwenguii]ROV54463.1 M48 family peptidase [Neisseria chenwenguii]